MPSLNGNGPGHGRRIDDVLALLENVVEYAKDGPQYMALCPAHNDHEQSLAVKEGDHGNVVLHCFAGCTANGPELVCEALGISVSYLFPDSDSGAVSKPSSRPESYIYLDADDTPLYKIQRTKDKQFYPYVYDRAEERFSTSAGMNGVKRVLYRLPAIIHNTLGTVFWVEGEKDADRLRAEKLLATTAPGGAMAPLPDLSPLSGRDVVIIPDNDSTGRSYAERVGEALEGIAASVKWLELPDVPAKGDVSDYLDGGGSIEALLALEAVAPEFSAAEGAPTRQNKRPKQRGRKKIGQDELREIWRARHSNVCWSREDWHRYDNGIWQKIKPEVVNEQMVRVIEEHQNEGVEVTGRLLSSILSITRPLVFVDPTLWDANPDVLVLQNGTLEISTRTLREHRPEDYVTSALPFAYDPDATAPVFRAVVQQAIPECHDFLQEFAGYSLTTDTSLETALWLKGPIGSGKSTIIEGITAMLGSRAGVLGLAEIENDNFALAQIPGKTLLTSTEQPASYMKSQHIINALISGEILRINRKFKDTEEIRPVAKIIWAMNDLPRVSSANAGIFRRVQLIPFPALPREKVDTEVKEIVKGEGAGILNWALDGLSRLIERGRLDPPAVMRNATAAWEHSNDLAAQFVEEKCVTGAAFEIAARTLYNAYREWALDGGHTPLSINRINDEWERLGFRYQRTKAGRFWVGVALSNVSSHYEA